MNTMPKTKYKKYYRGHTMLIEEILSEIKIEPYPYETYFDSEFEEGPALVGKFNTSDGSLIECFIFYKESDDAILINFKRDGETKATGKGDQFKIFGTVIEFFKEHANKMIKKFNPSHFIFRVNNAEQSRVSLYRRRLIPIISTNILKGNWNGPIEETRQDGNISGTYFIWDTPTSEEGDDETSHSQRDTPTQEPNIDQSENKTESCRSIKYQWTNSIQEGIGVKDNKLTFDYNEPHGQSTRFGKKKLEPYVTKSAMVNHNTIYSVYVKNDPDFVDIVKALKKKNDIQVDPDDYKQFLKRTTLYVARLLRSLKTDAIITPKSSHTFLDDLLESLKQRAPHINHYPSLYSKQTDISQIKVNYDDPRLTDKIAGSLEKILAKAKSSGTFEIKKILPQHRKFITGMFDDPDKQIMSKMEGKIICVLDDVFSTGHTLTDIITNIQKHDPENVFGLCIFKTK